MQALVLGRLPGLGGRVPTGGAGLRHGPGAWADGPESERMACVPCGPAIDWYVEYPSTAQPARPAALHLRDELRLRTK